MRRFVATFAWVLSASLLTLATPARAASALSHDSSSEQGDRETGGAARPHKGRPAPTRGHKRHRPSIEEAPRDDADPADEGSPRDRPPPRAPRDVETALA